MPDQTKPFKSRHRKDERKKTNLDPNKNQKAVQNEEEKNRPTETNQDKLTYYYFSEYLEEGIGSKQHEALSDQT